MSCAAELIVVASAAAENAVINFNNATGDDGIDAFLVGVSNQLVFNCIYWCIVNLGVNGGG